MKATIAFWAAAATLLGLTAFAAWHNGVDFTNGRFFWQELEWLRHAAQFGY